MIPAAFDYVRAGSADEAHRAARRARRRRQAPRRRPLAAAADEAAARHAGGARRHRPRAATCRTSATPATTSPSARSPATATSRRPTCCKQQVPILRARRRPGRRPAGAPPRHHRRLDRARRSGVATCPQSCSRSAARMVARARSGERDDRGGRLLHGLPRVRARARRAAHRDPRAEGRRARAGRSRSSTGAPRTGRSSASPRCTNGTTGIALVNMGSTPVRATAVEQALAGGASAADAAQHAAEGHEPPADLNASVEYREHLARVLVRRALEEAGA